MELVKSEYVKKSSQKWMRIYTLLFSFENDANGRLVSNQHIKICWDPSLIGEVLENSRAF